MKNKLLLHALVHLNKIMRKKTLYFNHTECAQRTNNTWIDKNRIWAKLVNNVMKKKMYFLFKILVLLIIMLTMYYVSKQFLTNIIILSLVYHNFFLYFSEEKPGRSADRMPVSLHISYHILIQLFFFFRYDLDADVSRRLNVIWND